MHDSTALRPAALALLCALVTLLSSPAPAPAQTTGAIIGLIGKATHASQELDLRLTEAQGAGNRTWAELQPKFEELLARHLDIAGTLRSAYALVYSAPGYDPNARVAGLPDGQVRTLDPVSFYHSAARSHQAVNERMRGLLDLYADELGPEADRYRADLEIAVQVAAMPRRW